MPSRAFVQGAPELYPAHVELGHEPLDDLPGGVTLCAFNPSDVSSINTGEVGQTVLR